MKMAISTAEELKKALLQVCKHASLKALAQDVTPFLFQATDAKKVELFDRYIQQVL